MALRLSDLPTFRLGALSCLSRRWSQKFLASVTFRTVGAASIAIQQTPSGLRWPDGAILGSTGLKSLNSCWLFQLDQWHSPRPNQHCLGMSPGIKGDCMSVTETNARVIAAPEVLGLETRGVFRDEAVELLNSLPDQSGSLVIDFAGTR